MRNFQDKIDALNAAFLALGNQVSELSSRFAATLELVEPDSPLSNPEPPCSRCRCGTDCGIVHLVYPRCEAPVGAVDATPVMQNHEADDLALAKGILDRLGVKGSTLVDRLVWVADRWLHVTGHQGSCACMQCMAARRLKRARNELEAESW